MEPNTEKLMRCIKVVTQQREHALNLAADLQVQLDMANERIANIEATALPRLAELEAKIAAAETKES